MISLNSKANRKNNKYFSFLIARNRNTYLCVRKKYSYMTSQEQLHQDSADRNECIHGKILQGVRERMNGKLLRGEACQKIAFTKSSINEKRILHICIRKSFITHAYARHFGGRRWGGARRENDPEPCQTKPNLDRNHSPPTDAAPNGIQFSAKSSGKG